MQTKIRFEFLGQPLSGKRFVYYLANPISAQLENFILRCSLPEADVREA